MTPEEIAAGLTKTQGDGISQAKRDRWAGKHYPYCAPSAARALDRKGLLDEDGALNSLGLAVRAVLEKQDG